MKTHQSKHPFALGTGLFLAASLLAAFLPVQGQAQTLDSLHSFTSSERPAAAPLVLGYDGNYYGITEQGGANNVGTVYQITPEGTFTQLASFNSASHGAYPVALISGPGGDLFGVASSGGAHNRGTVFKVTLGGTITKLIDFDENNGAQPNSLASGWSGELYGTTSWAGSGGSGTVFELDYDYVTDTWSLSTLASFDGSYGSGPNSILASWDGYTLYGTTISGGGLDYGTVFQLYPSSNTISTLALFGTSTATGRYPMGGLVQVGYGELIGTTYAGGSNDQGTIYKIGSSFTTLVDLSNTTGSYPVSAPIMGSDGDLYGTLPSGGGTSVSGTVYRLTTSGSFTKVFSFGTSGSSWSPEAGLVEDSYDGGAFFGTTVSGGGNSHGAIFRLDTTP